ncbi:DNA-binding transcription factor yap1 [Cryptotrichosporon argae]
MALTPNTAQFLDSLAFGTFNDNPTSLPPSAFFQPPASAHPIPGRDTPEDSPSSVEKHVVSDDSEGTPERDRAGVQPRKASASVHNKRKAGHSHAHVEDEEDEEDDSGDEVPSGHEDKRAHGNEKRGPRRSAGKDDAKTGKDVTTKAQRRKEQNRAAQKAFRERREAKVRDLEEKVAELEAKSFGANAENENLRGILKRLQEENVALKQAAFTFSVPHGTTPSSSATTPSQAPARPQPQPQQAQAQQSTPPNFDWSAFSNFKPAGQVAKPLSPPQSDSSVHGAQRSSSTNSASGNGNSPESLVSVASGSDNQRSLFDPVNATFNSAFDVGIGSAPRTTPPLNGAAYAFQPETPSASNDVDALFRNFWPNGLAAVNGIDAVIAGSRATVPLPQAAPNTQFTGALDLNPGAPMPYSLPAAQMPYQVLGKQTTAMSPADASSNLPWLFGDSTSYRDPSANQSTNATLAGGSAANWSDLADSSVSEFLASLTGQNAADGAQDGDAADEANQQQLQALLASSSPNGGSFSNLFSAGAFSPTNYLNMSPSPLNSIGTPGSDPSGTASGSASASTSNHTSPESTGPPAPGQGRDGWNAPCLDTFGPKPTEIVHIVGADGNIMRPSEAWIKIGAQFSDAPEDLVIDDLCDYMKQKATCKDGQRYITYEDVTEMVQARQSGFKDASVAANRTRAAELVANPKPYTADCSNLSFSQDQMPDRTSAPHAPTAPSVNAPSAAAAPASADDAAMQICPVTGVCPVTGEMKICPITGEPPTSGAHAPATRDALACQNAINEEFIANGGSRW